MSYYNAQFTYLGKANTDYNLIIVAFDGGGDNGAADSFLKMSSIKDGNYNGTFYHEYGAKYDSVANLTITMVKKDYQDFTIQEFRDVARWLNGAPTSSWLDVQNERFSSDTLCSFLCKCIDLQQYKLDGRVVGVIARFESLSPWAFSAMQCIQPSSAGSSIITGTEVSPFSFTINNHTDDEYNYIYPTVIITNKDEDSADFSLRNTSLNSLNNTTECFQISGLESIVFNSNHIITTDAPNKTMSERFNWVWPALVPGENVFEFIGTGEITIGYRYPIKIGEGMLGYDYSDNKAAIKNCVSISQQKWDEIYLNSTIIGSISSV